MYFLLIITFGAFLSAFLAFLVGGHLEKFLENRRRWLLVYGPSEYTREAGTRDDMEACKDFLQRVSHAKLDEDVRFRIVSGLARENYKVFAQVIEEMIERREDNRDILEILSIPLNEMGLRQVTYASLQSFFSYLNSAQLERLLDPDIMPVEDEEVDLRFPNARKRAADLVVSSILLIILSPIMVAIIILLWWESPAPIIRKTRHLGINGKPFDRYTFRIWPLQLNGIPKYSLTEFAIRYPDRILEDYDKSSQVTKVLINLYLYKLPELINVLKGDMSLIGPTPFPLHEFPYLTTEEILSKLAKRLTVRPGMIGKAQLKGHYNPTLTWRESVLVDGEYISSFSLPQDIQILIEAMLTYLKNIPILGKKPWFPDHVQTQASQLGTSQPPVQS
jgi:lipopolysaccharide/colanic/teichoic acid biosynthesis glycosyltransferase